MLWYKGWLETRFRLCMVLAVIGFVLYMQHSVASLPRKPDLPRTPECGRDCPGNDLHNAGGSGHRDSTGLPGDKRPPWFHALYPYPACAASPPARGPGRSRMAGGGGHSRHFLRRSVACIAHPTSNCTSGPNAGVWPDCARLHVDGLLSLRAVGDIPGRHMACVDDPHGFHLLLVVLPSRFSARVCRHLQRRRKSLAADRAHDTVEHNGLLSCGVSDSILRSMEGRAGQRVLKQKTLQGLGHPKTKA